jgi:hypothetical protein
MWRTFLFPLGALLLALSPGASFKFLVLHPLQGGSHAMQLDRLSYELAMRGHSITSLRLKNVDDFSTPLHPNITSIDQTLNNLDNSIAFVTPEREGK